MTKKRQEYIEKILVTSGFEPLLDYKKSSKTTQPPHMIYKLQQFTKNTLYITCTPQIKNARPLGRHFIARPLVCSSDQTV